MMHSPRSASSQQNATANPAYLAKNTNRKMICIHRVEEVSSAVIITKNALPSHTVTIIEMDRTRCHLVMTDRGRLRATAHLSIVSPRLKKIADIVNPAMNRGFISLAPMSERYGTVCPRLACMVAYAVVSWPGMTQSRIKPSCVPRKVKAERAGRIYIKKSVRMVYTINSCTC